MMEAIPLALAESLFAFIEGIVRKRDTSQSALRLTPFPEVNDHMRYVQCRRFVTERRSENQPAATDPQHLPLVLDVSLC